ncbi:MAG: hypothetical protein WC863_03455 [Patescibacteria group bacterium]
MNENKLFKFEDPSETEMYKLAVGATEAKRAGDNKLEKGFWIEASKLQLKDEFGVENLTTIEGVHLRRITEKVMDEQQLQETKRDRLSKEGDSHGAWLADFAAYEDLNEEIVTRWLLELYGVTRKEIPGKINDDKFKEYLRRLRENAHKI